MVVVIAASLSPARDDSSAFFTPDSTTLADCLPDDTRCAGQAFGNIAWEQGPLAALTAARSALGTGNAIEADCHSIAHKIGAAAYLRAGQNVQEAFDVSGDNLCNSGYYHGVAQAAFAEIRGEDIPAIVDRAFEICQDEQIDNDPVARELAERCAHGVGHGAMFAASGSLVAVISVCDGLLSFPERVTAGADPASVGDDKSAFATTCASGVFMEAFGSGAGVEYPLWERAGDLAYPCSAIPERYARECYTVLVSRFSKTAASTAEVAELCLRLPAAGIARCLAGYATQLSSSLIGAPDPGRAMIDGCLLALPWFSQCMSATLDMLGVHYESSRLVEPYCASLAEGWPRRLCGRTIGWTLSHRRGDEAECRVLAADLIEPCLLGLQNQPLDGGPLPEPRQGDYPADPLDSPWLQDLQILVRPN